MDIFIKDGTELDAVEYQFQFFFRSTTAALLPKVYLEQLSLLLLSLLHTNVFIVLPVPKEAHLKSLLLLLLF